LNRLLTGHENAGRIKAVVAARGPGLDDAPTPPLDSFFGLAGQTEDGEGREVTCGVSVEPGCFPDASEDSGGAEEDEEDDEKTALKRLFVACTAWAGA
jgi:hypothetical protein